MYTYYYKYDYENNQYIIYQDNMCSIILGIYKCVFEQDSLFNEIDNIRLVYKGEI